MQRIGHHPASAILRGINDLLRIGLFDRQIPILIVEDTGATEWASITFTGLRHVIDVRLEGEQDGVAAAMVRLADDLGDADMPMPGHFLAEIAVTPSGVAQPGACPGHRVQRLRIEALTLRD